MKVIFKRVVIDYFLELVNVLYEKEYFGYLETAKSYSRSLFEEIKNDLPNKTKKNAPSYFDRYGTGMQYSVFKKNKNTSWYVFFNTYHQSGETIYFVRFVSNNHVVAQYLN